MALTPIPDLGTRQLQAVLAVAEYRSFIAAASFLRTSQPALSRMVKRVEDVLGIAIFDRTTRSVEVTSAGREFLAVAERVINDLKISTRNLRELIAEQRGQVILACTMSIANSRLPAIVASYRKSRPAVEVHVREGVHGMVLEEVRSGSADFGLTYVEDLPAGLIVEPLGVEAFQVGLPEGHPLCAKESLSLFDLKDEPLVSLPLNAQTRRIIDGAAAAEGISFRHAVTVTQSPTMMKFIGEGIGPALLPYGATIGHENIGIVYRPLTAPQIERKFGIVRLEDRSDTPAAAGFQEELRRSWPGLRALAPEA